MNRRSFLKLASLPGIAPSAITSAALTSTACTHKKFYNPDQDIIIGGGQFIKDNKIHNVVAVTNLQQKDSQIIDTPFLAHEIVIDPNDKKRLLTFEKNGTRAAVIDLDRQEINQQFSADDNNNFSGYGAFDETGQWLYCVESNITTEEGQITIRDAKTLKVTRVLSTHGKRPQSCKLVKSGQALIIANRGSVNEDLHSKAAINTIEINENKLLSKKLFQGNNINDIQFAIDEAGNIITATASGLIDEVGQVHFSNSNNEFITITEPKALTEKTFGSASSICIDEENNMAVIAHSTANLLSFWLMKEQKLYKAMSVPNPRGVTLTLNKKHYIVNYGQDNSAILIRTKDLFAEQTSIVQPTYISGENIINWSKTLKEIMPGKVYN